MFIEIYSLLYSYWFHCTENVHSIFKKSLNLMTLKISSSITSNQVIMYFQFK